jgi:hypothetical protein
MVASELSLFFYDGAFLHVSLALIRMISHADGSPVVLRFERI